VLVLAVGRCRWQHRAAWAWAAAAVALALDFNALLLGAWAVGRGQVCAGAVRHAALALVGPQLPRTLKRSFFSCWLLAYMAEPNGS
jgi:hypothetical protein